MRVLVFAFAFLSFAQVEEQKPGSVSGAVKDAGTGTPMEGVQVVVYASASTYNGGILMTSTMRKIAATTDASGRYTLQDLPPGRHRVWAGLPDPKAPLGNRNVRLSAGQVLEGVDFALPAMATITGLVTDRNGEPLPEISVDLLAREYNLGRSSWFRKERSRTDDLGRFTLRRVEAGYPYIVQAWDNQWLKTAVSEVPTDPKLRKAVNIATFFPNSETPDGAETITLRAGEVREGVNITMLRAASMCVSGAFDKGDVQFSMGSTDVNPGTSRLGGLGSMPPGGKAGPDGKFRICGLRPGAYRMTAHLPPAQPGRPTLFGSEAIIIGDRDLQGVRVRPGTSSAVSISIEWAGEAPKESVEAKVVFSLQPAYRLSFMGEPPTGGRYSIPSKFAFPEVWLDEYIAAARVNAPGVYVKDIVHGNRSILHTTFHSASATDNKIKVLLANDGGDLAVQVTDKEGKPMPDVNIAVIAKASGSEAALAESLIVGGTDQDGNYETTALPPGKYLVLATKRPIDTSAHVIDRLWSLRTRAKEVEVAPTGSAQLKLKPVDDQKPPRGR